MSRSDNIPTAPRHLSPEAKRWWRKLCSAYPFEEDALLLVEGALEAFDRMREAQRDIQEHGIMLRSEGKMPRLNPATRVEKDSKATLLAYVKQLGLDLEPIGPVGRPPVR